MHANAAMHREANPEQYASNVAAITTCLGDLRKGDANCREEREQTLAANRKTPEGRSENHSAGCVDGGRNGGASHPKPNP